MRIIQVLTTISYGDAVGNDTLAIDKILKELGFETGIYAENIGKRIPKGVAFTIDDIPQLDKDDIIIYHLSTGSELNYKLSGYNGRKLVVFHNITPSNYFIGYNNILWNLCKSGLAGAKYLSDKVDYALADSSFNRDNLIDMEYNCKIDILPIIIPFEDYNKNPNQDIIKKYSDDGYVNILFTGRIAPNKCQEDIVAAFYQYHTKYNPKSRLFLVGNYEGLEKYYNHLKEYASMLGIEDYVVFSGHIPFDEILAYYHIADLFLCMSEHEGFCVPLVEAMYFDIPIVAFDSSAIGDTLGGSGIMVKEKNPVETAGLIDYIFTHEDIKEKILRNQRERLEYFQYDRTKEKFLSYLKEFIERS